jgi:hypothetical protein
MLGCDLLPLGARQHQPHCVRKVFPFCIAPKIIDPHEAAVEQVALETRLLLFGQQHPAWICHVQQGEIAQIFGIERSLRCMFCGRRCRRRRG